MFNQYTPWQMPKLGAAKASINWGGILSNTQKTLGIINQAIPIVYQMRPLVSNAKTLFKIAGAVKDTEPSNIPTNTGSQTTSNYNSYSQQKDSNAPQFFL